MDDLQGILFMVVGPPGAGKNTLMNKVLTQDQHLCQLATATTRKRRPNEREGREHLFVTPGQFRQMIADNALLEWQEVHPGTFYGVPRHSVESALAGGQNLIADIDVLGATYIRLSYPENVVLIFVKPPSVDTLAERMRKRGETEADIDKRMKRVAMELSFSPVADYVIVNDDLEESAHRLQSIIAAETARRKAGGPSPQRYAHHAVALPVYDNSVLWSPLAPHYPTTTVTRQQIPHRAALDSLSHSLGISTSIDNLLRLKPNQGSFIPPVRVDVIEEDNTKHISFAYVYLLPHRIYPGEDWLWRPIDEIDLPERVRQLLEARKQTSH